MRTHIGFLTTFAIVVTVAVSCSRKPAVTDKIGLIFETDVSSDIDDVLAMDMLYKYADADSINLLAIMLNKNGWLPAEFTDVMNTWYGHPDVPIALARNGVEIKGEVDRYVIPVLEHKDSSGQPFYQRSSSDYQNLPDAHILYRKILASRADKSVDIVSVGFSTNLARLLDTPSDDISPLNGRELVAAKVRLLSIMAGDFVDTTHAENNVMRDIQSAKKVFETWPTEMVFSPYDVGINARFPWEAIEPGLDWAGGNHPAAEAYIYYHPTPSDHPSWDLTSLLFAVEGGKWFTVSELGNVGVTSKGTTIFTPDKEGRSRILSVTPAQAEALSRHLGELVAAHPANK